MEVLLDSFSNDDMDMPSPTCMKRYLSIENIDVDIVFYPPWGQDKMTDDAKLAMGLL